MADYYNPNELRMSSQGFAWGSLVHTRWKSACLRKILIQSQGYQYELDPKYAKLGQINEDRHAKRLVAEGYDFLRESEFLRLGDHGINVRGHCDFTVRLAGRKTWQFVDELKSVQSKNVRREVIKNGVYTVENLAQLCRYMFEAMVTKGRLIYTYWERDEDNDTWNPEDERIFLVHFDDYGRIFVDRKPTEFVASDLTAHENAACQVIAEKIVWPDRPFRGDVPFVGACHFCPFKTVCNDYDSGKIEGADIFIEEAKNTCQGKSNSETDTAY